MIMTFDLFGLGKYRYTFRPKCEEAENCRLEDGTTRIFLNTKGKNPHEVSRELVEFLHYVEHTDNQTARNLESHRIKRIHDRVCRVRNSEEIGVKYMQAWEEKYYEREEARAEGLKEGLARGRSEGLKQGLVRGRSEILKQLVQKKLAKGLQISEIADALEEDEKTIQILVNELRKA